MPSARPGSRPAPLATSFGRLVHERGESRGVLLSAAVHLGVVAVLLWGGTRFVELDAAAGPGHGRGGGGGGGGNRTVVLLAPPVEAPPPPPAAVTAPILPTVAMPRLQLRPPDAVPQHPPPRLATLTALGPGAGVGRGAGMGPGAGTGSGGGLGAGVGPGVGDDSGGGGHYLMPQPQTVLITPEHVPGSLHGATITAIFEISARGEVVRVTLKPMPRDRKFAEEFIAKLRQYAFTPARTRDGRPIAAKFPVTFTLP